MLALFFFSFFLLVNGMCMCGEYWQGYNFSFVTPKWGSSEYVVDFLHWTDAKVSAFPLISLYMLLIKVWDCNVEFLNNVNIFQISLDIFFSL